MDGKTYIYKTFEKVRENHNMFRESDKDIKSKEGLLLQAAARCRRNGQYEMCAMWLSKYNQMVVKYG